jgi:hypothetical protein
MFFKTNLTVPKVKDLVNKPTEQYKEIFNTIGGKNSNTSGSNNGHGISNERKEQMKDELKNFMKGLSKKSDANGSVSLQANANANNRTAMGMNMNMGMGGLDQNQTDDEPSSFNMDNVEGYSEI